tara:strand:+ start:2999 stop:3628 length:630 start_codon:yes stop_codon:yes gene_type:complete
MKILLIPKIIETYKGQFEISVEKNLIYFLKYCFSKSTIEVACDKKKRSDLSLVIFSGGNTIKKFSSMKKDNLRDNFDKFYYKNFYKKLPIIGICHGAQYLADKQGSKFVKCNNHTSPHDIFLDKLIYKKEKLTKIKSHHNYKILRIKNFEVSSLAYDKSIESFYNKKSRVAGVIWHPERQKNINEQKKIILKHYEIISSDIQGKIRTKW